MFFFYMKDKKFHDKVEAVPWRLPMLTGLGNQWPKQTQLLSNNSVSWKLKLPIFERLAKPQHRISLDPVPLRAILWQLGLSWQSSRQKKRIILVDHSSLSSMGSFQAYVLKNLTVWRQTLPKTCTLSSINSASWFQDRRSGGALKPLRTISSTRPYQQHDTAGVGGIHSRRALWCRGVSHPSTAAILADSCCSDTLELESHVDCLTAWQQSRLTISLPSFPRHDLITTKFRYIWCMIALFFVVKVFSPGPKRKEDHFNWFQVAPIKIDLSKWRCECKPLLFRSFAKIFPNRYVAERNVAGILNSEVYIMSHYLLWLLSSQKSTHMLVFETFPFQGWPPTSSEWS